MESAIQRIKDELEERLKELSREGKLLEYERLKSRVNYDLEMLTETGYCSGIENYSRLMEDRPKGSPPSTLLDFFPKPFLLILDESHVTVPQIGGMSEGDRSRKTTLVEHGFRLPSAIDNRPLRWHEFEDRMPATLFVSATPAAYEMRRTGGVGPNTKWDWSLVDAAGTVSQCLVLEDYVAKEGMDIGRLRLARQA